MIQDNPWPIMLGLFVLMFVGSYLPLMLLARRLGYSWVGIVAFAFGPGLWPIELWIMARGKWPIDRELRSVHHA